MMQQPAEQAPFATAPRDTSPAVMLTARQREVAAAVAEGLSNAEIAERLVLTEGTVDNHLGHIMQRLGAKNRVHVAVWAVEHGLSRSGGQP
jgi:DNA-binding NarL/FixJ family response regulator